MSENTNTLFWVITGAVIVLAVFLLINTSSNNSLSTINDTFSSYWTDADTNTPKEEIDERYVSTSDNISFIKKGENIGYVQDLEVKITFMSSNSSTFGYYIKNISSKVISNRLFHLNLHRYEDKETINSFTWTLNNFYPGNQINLTAYAEEVLSGEYYFELVYD